jgi:hypothetical protein
MTVQLKFQIETINGCDPAESTFSLATRTRVALLRSKLTFRLEPMVLLQDFYKFLTSPPSKDTLLQNYACSQTIISPSFKTARRFLALEC